MSRRLTVTEDWRLYLVPWESLTVVSGSATSGVAGPTITVVDFRPPSGALLELWLDDLGLYRTKPAP